MLAFIRFGWARLSDLILFVEVTLRILRTLSEQSERSHGAYSELRQ